MRYLVLVFILLTACQSTPPTAISPQTVIDAFQAAGLEAESPTSMTPDDYGLAPMGEEGIRFLIPSLCADCGGRIIRYESTEAASRGKAYYDALGEESAAFFSWAFQKGAIVVQINGELPEEDARRYEAALNTLD